MNKIRIGNDIPIQWTLTRGDTAINLENASTLKLMIVASLATIEISDYTIFGAGNNILNFVFYGSAQRYCGSYRLIVIINQNIEGMMTIESQPIIELSAYAPQPTEPIATTGMTTDVILPSQSAYNIAIQNGFIGTEAEWLDSLIGESLYEMMIRTGRFVGTEEQFLLQYEDSLINVDQKASLAAEAANLANTKAELANTAAGNADALVSRLLVAIDYDPTDGDMYVILGSNNIIDAVETSEDGDVTLVCNF